MSDTCENQRPVVIASACLLGQAVRYDGGHKRDRYLDILAEHLVIRAICPEVGAGLGTPRPAMHLVEDDGEIRLRERRDPERDHTEALERFARSQIPLLAQADGFIAKSKSPSCGMARIPVKDPQGNFRHHGSGLFTHRVRRHLPCLPVEEEGRLRDPVLRENFLQRVFVHRRWRQLCAEGLTPAGLIDFHTRHKYMVMAHSVAAYRRLGRLLAQAGNLPLNTLGDDYFTEMMAALSRPARRGNHVNVLQHLAGYLSRHLSAADRRELAEAIESYRRGEVPLVVPLTLLRHHQQRIQEPYLARQYYLAPYPAALGLRNAI
ncbi:hypothetical protein MIT9_P2069 [Methylomarinovum caldicuralii]|uniref:DUF1722 domain-containing protein n=1 Tax=Methylomarinovum caldicuralii TaxID=438856 RepID=A0AAU9C428_9GAMM|nr:DUF1722 domain-containing protein [Methylomarinovum caldicuralii]BCX82483.1 hypothetical protein MIT9_P2069 [Methylomarinovum caldicuralii]